MVVTSGTSPATADIANDVEPWQWMIAFNVLGAGFIDDLAHRGRVVVQRRLVERPLVGRQSMLTRASSPATRRSRASSRASTTRASRPGARKMLARTPAPCTSITGPFVGARSPRTLTRLSAMPSPAVNGTIRSVVVVMAQWSWS